MDGLAAFKDAHPPKKEEAKEEVKPVIPKYEPSAIEEIYMVGGYRVALDNESRIFSINDDIYFRYEQIPDLVQFLAWAMRERMEVKADAEDKLQAEGCEV
jgi:hypothetical protein